MDRRFIAAWPATQKLRAGKPIRELRDLTRSRAMLAREKVRLSCRIQKVLEDANIKLSSVASDVLGSSGRSMLNAIIKGESDPHVLAEMAQKRLRAKIPQLQMALTGRLTEHHRFLLKQWLEMLEAVESRIAIFDQKIEETGRPFAEAVDTWVTSPVSIASQAGVWRRRSEPIWIRSAPPTT